MLAYFILVLKYHQNLRKTRLSFRRFGDFNNLFQIKRTVFLTKVIRKKQVPATTSVFFFIYIFISYFHSLLFGKH